jgi:hypothetical protein
MAKSEETINALMGKDISYIRDDIVEIKQTLKAQIELSATKADLAQLAVQVQTNKDDISNIRKFQYMAVGALSILSLLAPYILRQLNLI